MAIKEINVEFGKCPFEELSLSISGAETETEVDLESLRSGSLYFGVHSMNTKHTPFMLTPDSTDMSEVINTLLKDWELPSARIIMFAIADTDDSPSEQYSRLSRKLVKGLIHTLNTTEMWLFIDGLNHRFSRDIGRAFENELSRRKTKDTSFKTSSSVFSDTALIGVCRREDLPFSDKLGPKKLQQESEEKIKIKTDINRHCGYFIFVEDSCEKKESVSHFLLNFSRNVSQMEESDTSDFSFSSAETMKLLEVPVIALLLQGKITQIDLILGHLKLGLPLVVFEGSGGLADILAYAYRKSNHRPEGCIIAEYTETVLKPQISDMIHELYPEISDFKISFLTEKIFACIRYSKQREQEFITVLDLTDVELSPASLQCYLLKALFKSQASDTARDVRQMRKDLMLAMDWNSADVAKVQVFGRDTTSKLIIDKEMFYNALIKPQREEFVSLFLNQGFKVHTYLDSSNLLELFQNSMKREFFKAVVWESLLGFGSTSEIKRSFLDSTLIILIEELTGIPSLINSYELDWNCRAIYDDRTPEEAERKALTVLAMWAILSYRVPLVKTIWRHSEHPVHIALACSIIIKKLESFVTDLSVKTEMEQQAKEFSVMAASVMTLCFDNVPCRAIDLLKEKDRVWSYKVLMELSAFAKNKMFLAHPSCQKYLDDIFMGYIKVRDLPYGDITIPLWLKIILSAFFIFPIFLWVRFETPRKVKLPKKEEESSDSKIEVSSKHKVSFEDQSKRSSWKENCLKKVRFLNNYYYFLSAPITKFWVFQVFYALFLICFSLAVIWPACGNVFLDFFTCVWIAIFIIDSIYHAYTLNIKYTSMPLVYKSLEISLMILFLFGYVMGRIIWKNTFMSPYYAKVMLCVALIYSYYRFIFMSLPISSELGPMLYRIRRMVAVDFVSYIRVTILVIICNGIVMHAIVFPDHPLDLELVRKAFYDAFISFFLAPLAAYASSPNPKCIRLQRSDDGLSFLGYPGGVCKVGRYYKYTCPNPGVWPYLFGLQYLIILKMIALVMLFAIFSNTTRILEEEGKYIWKYQRYALVINFSNRLTLPPPLSIITLLYIFLKYIFFCCNDCLNKYILKHSRVKAFKRTVRPAKHDNLDENDFRYWKGIAMQYYMQKKQEKAEEMTTRKRMERVNALTDDITIKRRSLRELEGHWNELQIQIVNAHQYLKGGELQVSVRERLHAKNVPQIFSRISPYPNTMVSRFPVSDNHVPWKFTWTMYDPISFTLSKEDFPATLRPHVDVDIQKKREIEGESFRMPNFNWNKVTVSPGGICIDRKSWFTDKSGHDFEYELDSEDLPKNPLGRTGLKGRGCLPRWGPNHYIYVIITRWHETDDLPTDQYLDVLLMTKNNKISLPGGYVHTENRYEIINALFNTETAWRESDDMIEFFQTLQEDAISYWKEVLVDLKLKKEDRTERDFTGERIKLGYLDEETNTDQAWCEAEVWHFHYTKNTSVTEKCKENVDWHVLSEENLARCFAGQASLLYTVVKKMKAILEII